MPEDALQHTLYGYALPEQVPAWAFVVSDILNMHVSTPARQSVDLIWHDNPPMAVVVVVDVVLVVVAPEVVVVVAPGIVVVVVVGIVAMSTSSMYI